MRRDHPKAMPLIWGGLPRTLEAEARAIKFCASDGLFILHTFFWVLLLLPAQPAQIVCYMAGALRQPCEGLVVDRVVKSLGPAG